MSKRMLSLLAALSCLFFMSHAVVVQAQKENGSVKFRHVENKISNSYIVVFKESVSRVRVTGLARALSKAHGGELKFTYEHALPGFAVSLSESAAIALSKNPQVEYVEEEAEGTLTQQQLSPAPNQFYGIDRIDQRNLPLNNFYSGTGAGVGAYRHAYILDSGYPISAGEFFSYSFYQYRIHNAYDTFGGDGLDFNDHGSAVAGIIGGRTYGVAKECLLYTVKTCDNNGNCAASNVIAALNWVIANHVSPAVINMSLIVAANNSVDTAVRNAMAAGILVVAAAGNNNVNAANYSPARVPEILTVGATLKTDQRAPYSDFGAVDLYAPGGDVANGQGIPTVASNGQPKNFDGTSAAAPHVAGVAVAYSGGMTAYALGGEIKKGASFNRVTNLPYPGPDELLYSQFTHPSNVSHYSGSIPFYRYYNGVVGDHFYTKNFNELGPANYGWQFEWVACHIFETNVGGTVPLYQYYSSAAGDHFYTINFNTLGNGAYGYVYEKVAGYVFATQQGGSLPLYRYYNPQVQDHFYTTNFEELGNGRDGWVLENIECYVSP